MTFTPRTCWRSCVDALDEYPQVVLAHSYTAMIDGDGTVFQANSYPLATSAPDAPERFRSLLADSGGDDDGGVMRKEVLLRTAMKESYHHADRTIIAELALHGPFYQVPEWLYFRRDHPGRAERSHPSVRARCANMDPRRGNPWRNPVPRLLAEYVWAYVADDQARSADADGTKGVLPAPRAVADPPGKPHRLVTAAQPVAEAAAAPSPSTS